MADNDYIPTGTVVEPLSADGMPANGDAEVNFNQNHISAHGGGINGAGDNKSVTGDGAAATGGAAAAAATTAPVAPPPYSGLVNPSCICYLNSLVQCLFHTPAFRAAVYSIDTVEDPMDDTPKAMQSLFYSLSASSGTEAQSTKVLTDSFGWGPRDLAIQHDIQELLTKMREVLERRSRGRIMTLFCSQGERYFRALDGSYESANRESVYDIQLEINNKTDINSSIDALLATDQLLGTNGYQVEEPGGRKYKIDAEMGYRYPRFAPILFFHLKRFEMDMMSPTLDMKKINSVFQFPRSFDLSSREVRTAPVTEAQINAASGNPNLKEALSHAYQQQLMFPEAYGPDATHPEAEYELYAVLIHSGGVHHGHYTCSIRDYDKEAHNLSETRWYNYDDHLVTEIDEEHAVNRNYGGYTFVRGQQYLTTKNAYMLAYVRKSLIPKLFFQDDTSLLPDSVKAEFDKRIDDENRLARIEAEKNRQCHITLVTDYHLRENVHRRQTELLEPEHGNVSEVKVTVPKQTTLAGLYAAVSNVLEGKPAASEFRLHWFLPTGQFDSKFRVGASISPELNDPAQHTLEKFAPRVVQLPDRPWLFKLYVEFKVVQPSHVLTNAARGATFIPSTDPNNGLQQATSSEPAMPFVDNRMFSFHQTDLEARVEILLGKRHNIEAIAFQCPLPKNHEAGAAYACTRYDVAIRICDGDRVVYSAMVEHRRHSEHQMFICDHIIRHSRAAGGAASVLGDRVILQRVNVSVFDPNAPNARNDTARLADPFIISRLKVQVPPTELVQPADVEPRFISEDLRCLYLPVKLYSWRTCRMDFCGFISLPLSEFLDASFNVLGQLCQLTDETRIRIYDEHGTDAESIEAYRKHLTAKKVGDVIETTLIVQEEPPAAHTFIYAHPFVPSHLRSLATQRQIYLFNFKAPELACEAVCKVPEYATHDMVAEEVSRLLHVPWDRVRLYGCRETFNVGGVMHALPKPEPFRSDEDNSRSMLSGRREGVVFYEILRTSLKEAESRMHITCHFCDAKGQRISDEPFNAEIDVKITMPELTEMILDHFGFPFEQPHVFIDVQAHMIENFAIVLPPSRPSCVPMPVAGANPHGGGGIYGKNVEKFFRSFENKHYELRPFPEADNKHQVYCLTHGEYHHGAYQNVVLRSNPPPGFFPIPLTADVHQVKDMIGKAYDFDDDAYMHEPKHHEIMLVSGHTPLHLPTWNTLIRDYFFHNPTNLPRPKMLMINSKREKMKPGSRYVAVAQPVLDLGKAARAREEAARKKKEEEDAGKDAGKSSA